jgi:hypothetical protein
VQQQETEITAINTRMENLIQQQAQSDDLDQIEDVFSSPEPMPDKPPIKQTTKPKQPRTKRPKEPVHQRFSMG